MLLSYSGDGLPEEEDSVERRPLASLVGSIDGSCSDDVLRVDREAGSSVGSSTNPGG